MSRPLWYVNFVKRIFPGRFFLAKLTKIPVLRKFIDYLFFEGDTLLYIPRTKSIAVNEKIERYGELVIPSQIVEYFINRATHHWIMNKCICRDASDCKDYPIDLGCLFLGDAVLGINPRLGRLVSKEEALRHVKRCREAGLVHLIGRNKLDTVWLGIGPGYKLLTICNCCPCCCLWRIIPDLHKKIGSKITGFPGVTVEVTDACTGCGKCTEGICFVSAISIVDGKVVHSDECRGCGRCVTACPENAIELKIGNEQNIENSVKEINRLVSIE